MSSRRLALAALVAVALVAACGGNGMKAACPPRGVNGELPDTEGTSFPVALERLLAAGYLVEVDRFEPFGAEVLADQGFGVLGDYTVVRQRPNARAGAPPGAVVELVLDTPTFEGPIGMLTLRTDAPDTVRVPDLVGRSYLSAMRFSNDEESGIWVRVGSTAPLPAAASPCGLDAFVVTDQEPAPGTVVPYRGGGTQPSLSSVAITLGVVR